MAKFCRIVAILALGLPYVFSHLQNIALSILLLNLFPPRFLAAAVPQDVEPALQNLKPRPTSTCPGTRLSCDANPFATSFVTSGSVVITTTITTVISTFYPRPVTLPTTVTLPGSCFTYLIPTLQSNNDFCGPWTSKCGPTRGCTVTSTVTGMWSWSYINFKFIFRGGLLIKLFIVQARAEIHVVPARRWCLPSAAVGLPAINARRLGKQSLRLLFVRHDWEALETGMDLWCGWRVYFVRACTFDLIWFRFLCELISSVNTLFIFSVVYFAF